MATFITVLHVFVCVFLILTVLVQSGKGAEIGAVFGGSSQSVFGSSGGMSFFAKFTTAVAIIFMITSVILTIINKKEKNSSVMAGANVPVATQNVNSNVSVPNAADPAATANTSSNVNPAAAAIPASNTGTPAAATTNTNTATK